MSSKRMLGIVIFGAAFIALFIGLMLLTSYLSSGPGELALPDTETSSPPDGGAVSPAPLARVEVTPENVQAVIETLTRPESYTRVITIESYWDGSSAVYNIEAAVSGGYTSLKTSSGGIVKRVIVTPDKLYLWNDGDFNPREREYGPSDNWRREADEWQMLLTYEDVLELPKNAISDAGYVEYGGESCIFVEYSTGRLGYTVRCYISDTLGLLIGAEEYDGQSPEPSPTYKMSTGTITVGEPNASLFALPDGTSVHSGSVTSSDP